MIENHQKTAVILRRRLIPSVGMESARQVVNAFVANDEIHRTTHPIKHPTRKAEGIAIVMKAASSVAFT